MRRESSGSFIVAFVPIALFIISSIIVPVQGKDNPEPSSRVISEGSSAFWPTPFGPTTLNSTVTAFTTKDHAYVEWVLPIPEGINGSTMSPPVIDAEGRIYFTFSSYLFCADDNGSYLWYTDIGNTNSTLSAPSITPNGQILITTDLGYLVSCSPDGNITWDIQILDRAIEPTLTVSDNRSIYFGLGNEFGCISTDGGMVWKETLSGEDIIYPPSISRNGFVYIPWERDILCYSGDGDEIWSYRLGSIIKSPPVIDEEENIWITSGGIYDLRLNLFAANGTLLHTEIIDADMDPTTPVILNDGRTSLSPAGSEILLFNGSRMLNTISFELNDPGYYYIDSKGRSILMEYHRLFVDDGYYEFDMNGDHSQLAFSSESVYYTEYGLHRISFDDVMHPSFSSGPVRKLVILEDEVGNVHPSDYFTIPVAISLPEPFSMEFEGEGLTIELNSNGIFIIIPDENLNGEFDLRIRVEGMYKDGSYEGKLITYSNWFKLVVLPVNDPPYAPEEIENRTLPPGYEGQSYSTEIRAYDIDSDESRLSYYVDSREFYMEGNILKGIISRYNDVIDIDIFIWDPEGAMSEIRFIIPVLEADETPDIWIHLIRMNEDESQKISIGGRSSDEIRVEDPDGYHDHTYNVELGPGLTITDKEPDSFELKPEKDWYGETWFIFHLTDNTGTYHEKADVTVENIRDPVENLRIIPLTEISNISQNDLVSLKVEFDDPDNGEYEILIDWGSLDWKWAGYDPDNGYTYLNGTFYFGVHKLIVEVDKGSSTKSKNATIEINVSVSVIPEGFVPVLEHDHEGDELIYRTWLAIHSFVLLFLCLAPFSVFIVRTLIQKRKEKPERSGKEVKE